MVRLSLCGDFHESEWSTAEAINLVGVFHWAHGIGIQQNKGVEIDWVRQEEGGRSFCI